MKKFVFSSQEIDAHKSDSKEWHNFVRRREGEIAFSIMSGRRFHLALELGAGNGGQSEVISKYCDRLICTELDQNSYAWLGQSILNRSMDNVEYQICDAQDLSRFEDGCFDLIFSSNMLLCVPDLHKCLMECHRVLKDDGVMLHMLPNRCWKIANAVFNLAKLRPPTILGVSKYNIQEFYAFGTKIWRQRFRSAGLIVSEVVGLPFYAGHKTSFIPMIKAGNTLGLCASYLYVVRKK